MNVSRTSLVSLCVLLATIGLKLNAAEAPLSLLQPVQPPRAVQVMAGPSAMPSVPPNTIRAIEQAWGDSIDWIELDVRVTKDGQHVLFQAETLDQTTNGTGRVRETPLAEIEKLDVGTSFARRFAREGIPSLKQAIEYARSKINLKLNCVDVDPVRLVHDLIVEKMDRQVLLSGDVETLSNLRKAGGKDLVLSATWTRGDGLAADWIDRVAPGFVEIPAGDLTPEIVKAFHRRGIRVLASMIGKPDRPVYWERAIESGVDALRTGVAEEVATLLSRKAISAMPVRITCHRGAGRYAPENTFPAFEKAFHLGADLIEFDVRTTRDGGPFLMHDASLNRTTSGKGQIRAMDDSDVRQLDAGSWFARPYIGTRIPSLDDFLEANGRRMELYFDAKDIAPEVLARTISRHGLTERTIVYQSADYLAKLKEVAPGIRRMPPLGNPDKLDELAERVKPYAVDAKWSILNKTVIDQCHAKGIKVFSDALGANETIPRYQQAIRDGIDVIQTDQPVRVLRAIEIMKITNKDK